ncbi:MAG: DUF1501 domain-containing protein [Verrucomicrobiota bacterium]|nr:DUF1501 domain-containing protein [Verrucomicrobiota bacterium]
MNPEIHPTISRRQVLATSLGCAGFSLTDFLQLQSIAKENKTETKGKAKSCIILFAWGGMSHLETWDPKPEGPKEIRGSFDTIPTATPGIHIGEHMPYLAKQTNKLAIVRSMHHGSSAHGKAMYWNFTGHKPPQSDTAANLPPSSSDWPSLLSVISKFKSAPPGLPSSIRIPYPLVDNGTLQAGEYGGWLGSSYNPIVIRTPKGKEFGGVSRDLGASRIDPKEAIDRKVLSSRLGLLGHLDQFQGIGNSVTDMDYFRNLATDMLMSPNVRNAFDLDLESQATKDKFGNHICGQSMLLARRLVQAEVPIVTVACSAGDLNGSAGDHWDTHADNFNRIKNTMLPAFDRPAAALLDDLDERGMLDETLVVFLTEFGRTPKINKNAGRDHYPSCYSVAFAGAGIQGGQVYGKSDKSGSEPAENACGPADLHATIFEAFGINHKTTITDRLGRPFPISDGEPLPLT